MKFRQFSIMLNHYLKEFKSLKYYVLTVIIVIILSYSVYFLFDVETVSNLGKEDQFFEWLTSIFLFVAFLLCFTLFIKTRNIFFMLLSIIFFFGAGEEISWGQRIFGFKTPEIVEEHNVQNELTIHNLEYFNGDDMLGHSKKGFQRLLEMNFLYRLFMLLYGIILPIIVHNNMKLRKLTQNMRLPIPPISLGIFFLINWFGLRILKVFVISPEDGFQYYDTAGEIFECLGAFIFLVISIYFYFYWKKIDIEKAI